MLLTLQAPIAILSPLSGWRGTYGTLLRTTSQGLNNTKSLRLSDEVIDDIIPLSGTSRPCQLSSGGTAVVLEEAGGSGQVLGKTCFNKGTGTRTLGSSEPLQHSKL